MRMIARNKVIDGDYKGKAILGGERGVRLLETGTMLDVILNRKVIVRCLEKYIVVKWEHTDDWKKKWTSWLWVICNAISRNPNSTNVYWLWIEFWSGERSLIEIDEENYRLFLHQMEYGCDTD